MSSAQPTVPFGAAMKEHFLLDPKYRNLNHGSFGTYPKAIQTALHQYQTQAEATPDPFIRVQQPQNLDKSRRALATLLHVPASEIVLVKNATTGVNTVLRNIPFTTNDVIIYFDTAYGAVERSFVSLTDVSPVQLRKVSGYVFPCSHAEIVDRFRATVKRVREVEGLNPKLAVFDTIVSVPGVRFPFEALTGVCREEGIMSLIDGAHGVGMIPLNLDKLGVDFFTSNCHKWLYTPRGSAVLYVRTERQHLIRTTLPTSWGFIPRPDENGTETVTLGKSIIESKDANTKSAFVSLFEFVATSDDTPYMCIPDAIQWRQEVCGGEENIYSYLQTLANEGGEIVARALGTEVMGAPGDALRACGMVTVRLPLRIVEETEGAKNTSTSTSTIQVKREYTGELSKYMQDQFLDKGTFLMAFTHGDWMWTRLSAQIYLERSDFEWVAGLLKDEILPGVEGFLASLEVKKLGI